VDIHVHVFAATMDSEYLGEWSVRPDGFTFRSGVTTAVDAGSAGWRGFANFKELVIDRSKTRILAWVNIVGRGMGGRKTMEQEVSDMEPGVTAEAAKQYKDVAVGIKIAHFHGPGGCRRACS
jgi:dihydroorotase